MLAQQKPKELLSTGDAADILQVAIQSVRMLVDEGKLQLFAVTPKGQRLFERSRVEALRQHRIAHPPKPGRKKLMKSRGAMA